MGSVDFGHSGTPVGTDRAARSLRTLIVMVGGSVLVLSVFSRLMGPVSIDGWHADAVPLPWELHMSVRSTIWYAEVLLVSVAAWMLWVYPQPGLRKRGIALAAGNLVLAAIVRPILLALVPELGDTVLWLLVVTMSVLAGILGVAAAALARTHRVSSLLMIPCLLWALYIAALNVGRILAA